MASWGKSDVVSNSVSWAADLVNAGSGNAAKAAASGNLFSNSTGSAFVRDQAVGVFGVSVAEKANTSGESKRVAHAGWNLRRAGTGPLATLVIATGGTGYANTDTIKVSGGKVNAAATLVTNSTGGITSVSITNPGEGFVNTTSVTVAVANSTGGATGGSNATFTVTLGGRAGRVHYETLVAMGTMSNGVANTFFPK